MIKKVKKIAILHTEFFYSGGAEKLIFNQVNYLQKKGFQIDVFCGYLNKKTSFSDLIDGYNITQLLPYWMNKFIPQKLIIILTLPLFLIWIKKLKNYDVYIGENQIGPWYAYLASIFNKKRFLTYQPFPTTFSRPRKIDKISFLLRPFSLIDKYILSKATVSFANGIYAKEVLESTYQRDFINCPAGAKRQKFNKKIFDKRLKDKYVLITNRNMPKKRLDWLDKIIPSGIKTIIVGQGTKKGLVSEEDLKTLYQSALVYIYPAPEEDFGMGIVEAMSFGVPVIAWNYAGPSKIIIHGRSGYLAKPYVFSNFRKLVSKLIENPQLNYKMSKYAYEESKKYTWEKHADILEKFLLHK